jgi:GDP-L-fucose synthase
MNNKKVLITGASGFVGANICDEFTKLKINFIPVNSKDYDLMDRVQVDKMFIDLKPDYVVHCAALSGGILANKSYPADYCFQNLTINTNVFDSAYKNGVSRFLTFIGGCSYPAKAPNPILEDSMWDGYPQKESAPYSVAKKMMLVLSESYRIQYGFDSLVCIPGNLYGPYDNYNLQASHVIPALIRKFWEAKNNNIKFIEAWGSGMPVRDFMFSKDLAKVVPSLLFGDVNEVMNISSGSPTTIKNLTEIISKIVGFEGEIIWDKSKPDGQMEKLFSIEKFKKHQPEFVPTDLEVGIKETYEWFVNNLDKVRL